MTIAVQGVGNFAIPQNTKAQIASNGVFDEIKKPIIKRPIIDVFTPLTIVKLEPPKISFLRLCFNRLTQEQIDAINLGKRLPKNAKFRDNEITGEPYLTWNLADITKGTHKLPVGYELKNDILGFTHVVREGTQAWYLKK